MARRVFLHVGPPKTATTWLQAVLWSNKQVLKDAGTLVPLAGPTHHFWCVQVVRHRLEPDAPQPQRTAWSRLLNEVDAHDGDAIISHEIFGMAEHDHARVALDDLRGCADEVHVVVSARPLTKSVPSNWQQRIKMGNSTETLAEYLATPTGIDAMDPASTIDRWALDIPPDRTHVVPVPRNRDTSVLWGRFAEAIGAATVPVDLAAADADVNPSMGPVATELMRRMNMYQPEGMSRRHRNVLRIELGDRILAVRPTPPAGLDRDAHERLAQISDTVIERIVRRGVRVHGDLEDLRPAPWVEPETCVDAPVSDEEVARLAVEVMPAALVAVFERGLQNSP